MKTRALVLSPIPLLDYQAIFAFHYAALIVVVFMHVSLVSYPHFFHLRSLHALSIHPHIDG
jgi:hypothetical protein